MAIDAPETSKKREPRQPYSREAKEHLNRLIHGKVVDVKGYGLDRYNRVLAVVYVDGKNVNLALVKTGLAEVYRGKMRGRLRSSDRARSHRGAWAKSLASSGLSVAALTSLTPSNVGSTPKQY